MNDIERRPGVFVGVHKGTALPADVPRGMNRLDRAVDITPMVESVRTRKDLHSPVGTFELSLTFRSLTEFQKSSLNKILVPDNMALIAFDKGTADSTLENVMEGYITRAFVRESVSDSGKPERQVFVTGWDAGKFLARHEIPAQAVSARIWGREEEAAREISGATNIGGTVTNVAIQAFRLLTSLSQIAAATRGAIELFIDPSVDRLGGVVPSGYANLWLRLGKFWHLFTGICDEPWNEVYADFQPADSPFSNFGEQFNVILRRRPFDQEDWDNLPLTVVRDHELRYADAALADDERVNLIYPIIGGIAAVTDASADQLAFLYSLFDSASMKAHGTQPYYPVKSIYVNTIDDVMRDRFEQDLYMKGQGTLAQVVKLRGRILWRWFSINHLLFKGSWVVKGDPHIHIGTRVENQREPSDYFVLEEGERRQYYVEQVVQDFNVRSRSYFTHLGITRGQPLGQLIVASEPQTIEGKSASEIVSSLRGGTVFEGGIAGPAPPAGFG